MQKLAAFYIINAKKSYHTRVMEKLEKSYTWSEFIWWWWTWSRIKRWNKWYTVYLPEDDDDNGEDIVKFELWCRRSWWTEFIEDFNSDLEEEINNDDDAKVDDAEADDIGILI